MSRGQDFLDSVIVPALDALMLDSVVARQLLLGTAMQESGLRDINQIGGGPAKGPFEIEDATRADITHWATVRHPEWAEALERLEGDIKDAATARLLYERAPGTIGTTPEEQAAYYKQWYNTPRGAATVAEYLANWKVVSEGVVFDLLPLEQAALPASPPSPTPLPVLQPVETGAVLSNLDEPVTEIVDHGLLPEPVTTVEDQGGLTVTVMDLGPAPAPEQPA
jgi:hypothetical protein